MYCLLFISRLVDSRDLQPIDEALLKSPRQYEILFCLFLKYQWIKTAPPSLVLVRYPENIYNSVFLTNLLVALVL